MSRVPPGFMRYFTLFEVRHIYIVEACHSLRSQFYVSIRGN